MFNPKILDEKIENAKISEYSNGFLMEFPKDINHPPILHVKGTPRERGKAYGYLLADRIKELISRYGTLFIASLGGWLIESRRSPKSRHIRKGIERTLEIINDFLMPAMEKQVPEILEEMKGIHEGLQERNSPVTWEHLLAINCSPEPTRITQYSLTGGSCSSFSAWDAATIDGELIHGANLDEMNFDYLHKSIICIVCKPKKGK